MGVLSCEDKASSKTIYLFRHAEKVLGTKDDNPPLTKEGERQAVVLSELLKDSGLKEVYSTRYVRNLSTIAPLVDSTDVQVHYYEWEEWEKAITKITTSDADVVAICGHGDILLPMIEKLGGVKPQEKIEKHEYKKLYKLLLDGNKVTVETTQF